MEYGRTWYFAFDIYWPLEAEILLTKLKAQECLLNPENCDRTTFVWPLSISMHYEGSALSMFAKEKKTRQIYILMGQKMALASLFFGIA